MLRSNVSGQSSQPITLVIEVGDVDLRCLQDFYQSRQRRQGPLHPVSGELPPGAQKPPARRAAQSISIRDSAVRAVHDTPYPANCSRLPGDGRHYAAAAPASVPPSDADLPDVQGPLRRTDSADNRATKAKRALRSTNTCHSNRSISVGI